ncbi:MAG: hypothetical protein HYY84_16930 [Deltaproteobacteria bacterium]|nr:hypothetical protein [Deltaproteobacteria bacterium]
MVSACDVRVTPQGIFLQSFQVTIRGDAGVTGSLSSRLPSAANTPATFTVDVQAVGSDGLPYTTNESIFFTGSPGEVTPCSAFLINGQLTGQLVTIVRAFGRATINAFTGEFNCQSAATLDAPLKPRAIGSSQQIYFPNLSIAEVQGTTLSPFVRKAVRIDQGTLIVTHVTQDGFYVGDITTSAYGNIFAYTHSRPDDLFRGDRLTYLAGGVVEFPRNTSNGFTEVNFPSWAVDRSCGNQTCDVGAFCTSADAGLCQNRICTSGSQCNPGEVCSGTTCQALSWLPAADVLTSAIGITYASAEMEKRESSFVRVDQVKVSPIFKNCDFNNSGECEFCGYCDVNSDCPKAGQSCVGGACTPCDSVVQQEEQCESDCENDVSCSSECDYKEYGQWKVILEGGGGSAILVNSRDTVPDFDPKQNLGAVIKFVQGMLRDVPGKPGWVIEPRDPRDLSK